MKIAVTGSTGFIGARLVQTLASNGHVVNAIGRKDISENLGSNINYFHVENLGVNDKWHLYLEGVNCIIHCAARAHVLKESISDPLAEFLHVNVDITMKLVEQAHNMRVRRFIYISSIGVLGSNTNNRSPFSIFDEPSPTDFYSLSKLEAEISLKSYCDIHNIELVIVRPPLVYGHGVKGNFERMIKAIKFFKITPLGSIQAKRSFIGLDNLVSFLICCSHDQNAINQLFLVSDGVDISVMELMDKIASHNGYKLIHMKFSLLLISLFSKFFRIHSEVFRLIGALQVDISYAKTTLNWEPPYTIDHGIADIFGSNVGK